MISRDLTFVTYADFLPILAVFLPFFDPGPSPLFLRTDCFAFARPRDVPFILTVQIVPFLTSERKSSRVIESAISSSLSGSNRTLFAPTPNNLATSSRFFLILTGIKVWYSLIYAHSYSQPLPPLFFLLTLHLASCRPLDLPGPLCHYLGPLVFGCPLLVLLQVLLPPWPLPLLYLMHLVLSVLLWFPLFPCWTQPSLLPSLRGIHF